MPRLASGVKINKSSVKCRRHIMELTARAAVAARGTGAATVALHIDDLGWVGWLVGGLVGVFCCVRLGFFR